MIQSHFNSLAENSWKAIELRHARRRQFNYLSLGFYLFFLSFCLSSPTIDVDFIDCKKKSRAAVAIERRWREITLLGNKIFHDAIGATTQKKPLYWHFILFELIVIYILHLPLVRSIHSRWISLLGYLMRFYAKEWNSCADF